MFVIYTYLLPPWEEAKAYARRLSDAAGPGTRAHLRLLPVDGFSNPFDAWLKAPPLVRTKYTLLMHNDVFLLDGKGLLLSELHGALEAHPEHAVAAPQIYETEVEGLMTTHLFNTNLHLRRTAEGVAFMSHEVDLLAASRASHPTWTQRRNDNFLEDHAFLARTEALRLTEFIDPRAAFTLEYVDLHLNMLRAQPHPAVRSHGARGVPPMGSRMGGCALLCAPEVGGAGASDETPPGGEVGRRVPQYRLLQLCQVLDHPPRLAALVRPSHALGRSGGPPRLLV